MTKKIIIILVCCIICVGIGFGIYYIITKESNPDINKNNGNNLTVDIPTDEKNNEQVITTNSNSTIRVVNYYDEEMFKGKNTILFMWGSWCPNCEEEFDDLNKILQIYKNDKDVNIVFIAHEFKQDDGNIDSLLNLLEGGTVDFDTEILLDYGRVIRKHIDPEEGYIPRTYFLNKDCSVLEELTEPVTFEQVESLINKYYK